MQSRYYNPEWGRFINADGITGVNGELLSHNIFAYCMNNPINKQDVSGHYATDVFGENVKLTALTILTIIVSVVLSNSSNLVPWNTSSTVTTKKKPAGGKDETGLPAQGPIDGGVSGAPMVDAGSQKKHVPTHKGTISTKTQWPVGENGVTLTQEGWLKGYPVKDTPDEEVRVWDTGDVIGQNGETRVKVHMKKKTGMIHGYPD